MCQEIGHIFGLGHQDEIFDNANLDTCMDYTSSTESNQHPNKHDFDQLNSICGHTDSFNSFVAAITGGGSGPGKINGNGKGNNGKKGEPPGEDVSQWGKAIGHDR